jgi:hypothetical protein
MTTAIKRRRGTTSQHSTFTGLEGELTIDTTKDTAVVHDGATAGGRPLLREDLANNTEVVTRTGTQTLTNKSLNGTLGATTPSTVAATTISASGVSTFSAGSAGAPAITTTGDTNTGIFFPAADTIAFSEGGTEVMRIDSGGNVGIGVTPTAPVAGQSFEMANGATLYARASAGVPQFYISSNAVGTGYAPTYKVNGFATQYVTQGFDGSHQWLLAPSGTAGNAITFTQAMILNSSGNLGLGVVPSAWFSTSRAMQIGGGGVIEGRTGIANYLSLAANSFINSAGADTYIATGFATRYYQNTGNHIWLNAPSGTAGTATTFTQAMTLTAAGNLGIGATSPLAKLDVSNKFRVTPSAAASGEILAGTQVDSYNANFSLLPSPAAPGTNTIQIMAYSPTVGWKSMLETSNKASGSPDLILAKTAGNVLVGLTSATSGGAKLQTVDGITFPATQVASANANTLDDYEEGTWTPTVTSSVGAITTYTSNGQYTKIGRQVTVNGTIVISDNGTGTGSLNITNFPFTIANGIAGGTARETTISGVISSITASGTGTLIMWTYNNNYPGGTGATLQFTATYFN